MNIGGFYGYGGFKYLPKLCNNGKKWGDFYIGGIFQILHRKAFFPVIGNSQTFLYNDLHEI